MGTNFYLKPTPCITCGHSKNEKHIGKCSYGWQFHFRGYLDESIVSYDDWLNIMHDEHCLHKIYDEYGKEMAVKDFMLMIENKKEQLNHYNIVNRIPMTDKEREYLEKNPQYYPVSDHKNWKDDKGHSFTDNEFC